MPSTSQFWTNRERGLGNSPRRQGSPAHGRARVDQPDVEEPRPQRWAPSQLWL